MVWIKFSTGVWFILFAVGLVEGRPPARSSQSQHGVQSHHEPRPLQQPSSPTPEPEALHFVLDQRLHNYTDNRALLYSSNLFFPSAIPGDQDTENRLLEMGKRAQSEMNSDLSVRDISRHKRPKIVAVLAIGRDIFLASSMKGIDGARGGLRDWPKTPVSDLLKICLDTYTDQSIPTADAAHRNNAACGEIMAAEMFYIKYPDRELTDGRIMAVDRTGALFAPCNDISQVSIRWAKANSFSILADPNHAQSKFGCEDFLKVTGLKKMAPRTPEPYSLNTLAGNGAPLFHEISLTGAIAAA